MDKQLDTTKSPKARKLTKNTSSPRLSQLMSGISNAIKGSAWKLSPAQNNTYAVEQLEPRLLLSADPLAALTASTNDVTLQVIEKSVNDQNVQFIQLVDTQNTETVLGEKQLSRIADAATITITGTDSNDRLTVDQSFLDLGERNFIVQFDGAQGTDTVALADTVETSHWQINGENAGSLGANGIVEFLNTEAIEATNSQDSQHVLSAINNSYNWGISAQGNGIVSVLEQTLGTIVDDASSTQVSFTGFDEIHGSSTDYLDYRKYAQGVSVDLEEGSATGFDSVSGFNTLIGSSHSDVFAGDTNNNLFVVGFGDSVDGAGGGDSVVFRESGSAGVDLKVEVNSAGSDFTYKGGSWNGTTFTETADQVVTLVDVDLLSAEGGTGDNYFDFSAADVSVYLVGGAGDDTLIGGSEDDVFVGGAGDDTITGHAGDDEVIAARSDNFELTANKLKVGSNEEDTYNDIESVYLKAIQLDTDTTGYTLNASGANDFAITLEGTDLADTITASKYGDTLIGLGGADTITAGIGLDRLQEAFSGRAHIATSGANYELDLSHGTNEIISVTLPTVTSGSGYTLTFNDANGSYTTDEISWGASTRDFSSAIEKALNLNYGQIIVSEITNGWTVEFAGLYAGQAVLTSIDASNNNVSVQISQAGSSVKDTLIGFSSSDYIEIEGSVGADDVDLSAFIGNTEISTFAGIDSIRGAQGVNTIDAGDDADFIYVSGNSNDFIIGGSGEDTLLADMSNDVSGGVGFDLDNDKLAINASLISLDGIETAELTGSTSADTFDTSGFHGVSASTEMANIEGWAALTEHTLRFTLDDGSTVIDLDVQGALTLDALIDLINLADDRETDAMNATFDQATATLSITGINALGAAGSDISILSVLGLNGAVVSNSMATGVSMSLLASIQLTTQRGNGGADTFTGSKGIDQFYVDSDDVSVTAGSGYDTVTAETTATHDELTLSDTMLTWSDSSNGVSDKTLSLSGVEQSKLIAISGATKLDASSATIDAVLDAGQTNATMTGGSGYNEFRVDVSQRTDDVADKVLVTVDDNAQSNDIVFYGGESTFNAKDFSWTSVSGTNYALVSEANGNVTIDNDLTISGQSIKFRAGANKITVNADITTDGVLAGNIELYARHIEVRDGVTISAIGDTLSNSGDITLFASDSQNKVKGLGFYNYDKVGASITIGAATLQGKDIELLALAETNPDSPVNYGGETIDSKVPSINEFKDELESASLFVGYSRSVVDTKITVAEGALLSGDNVTIEARSIARVTSQPLAFLLSVAIGNIKSTAIVEMDGTILAEGDVTITSNTENYLYVNADQFFGFKGFSASVAVGLLESDSLVTVSETATIVAQGDLEVKASTSDFTYVGALSDAGGKGKLAASVAVHIEHGDTIATLAGDVFVLGDVNVNAVQKQGRVNGAWGTLSSAIVDRVPSILDNFKDKYKQKASNVLTNAGLKWLGKKASPNDRLKPTKFTLGLAFAYSEDTNNANSYIGIDGESSDIQVGGSLNQTATVDSRLLTSVTAVSSSISNTKQLAGSTGTKSEFSQVPFGGAVSVSIGNLKNDANAVMLGNTSLDVLDKITLDAKTENLTGLLSSDTTFKYVKPSKISTDQIDTDYNIKTGDLIQFGNKNYDWQQDEAFRPDIGIFGAVYKFVGQDDTIRMASEDFSDTSRWELLGDQVTSIPNQLFGGESDLYLVDNTVKTEAAGAKVSIGLNFGYLDADHNADAKISGDVEVNQREALENTASDAKAKQLITALLPNAQMGVRGIDITSSTTNKSVDYVGLLTDTTSNIPVLKQIYAKSGASQSLNGSGASVYLNNVTLNSDAIVENGAKVYADEMKVKADNTAFAINLGYSAGYGIGTLGMSGLFMGNYVESNANARIDSGVALDIATRINNAAGVEKLSVTADNRVDILTVAGGGASGGSIGIGASAIMNEITKVTKAQIGNSNAGSRSGDVNVNGDAKVSATSEGFVFGTAMSAAWATGKVAPSGGEEPEVTNSDYGVSVSGAFIFNNAKHTTEATVNNLNSFNADALSLDSTENALVLAFPISYASAEANSFALAAAGIGLRNDVEFDIDAGMKAINSLTLDTLSINALNNSTVVTASISAALSGIAETSASTNSSSIAITGNVSINNVTSSVDAFLSDVTSASINSKNSHGFAADIKAEDRSDIYAIALGVAYAGNGSVGVTYAENNIESDIDALISNSDITVSNGKLRHRAVSEADILSVALGAAVSKDTSPGFDTKVGVSVAAAVSYNQVRMNTRAKIVGSDITLPAHDLDTARLDVNANNEADIIAVVVAPSVGLQSGGTTTVTLTGAGASVVNEVYGDTIAQIDDSNIDQISTANAKSDADNGVYLNAYANGDISASVISAAVAYASATTGTGVSGGIGVSLAENYIGDDNGTANAISALITNSNIDVAGSVDTYAESKQEITSVVISASVAIAQSTSGTAAGLSGVGASSDNIVMIDTTSGIMASQTKTITADLVSVEATDTSKATSAVVGASIAGSYSASGASGALTIGVSLAENNIDSDTSAVIDGVTLGSSSERTGAVTLKSTSNSTITATSVAASLAVAISQTGAASLSGAGANAINRVKGSMTAQLANSTVYSSDDVKVSANNTSKIKADIAAVSLAVSASKSGGIGAAIGAAVTENYLGDSGSRLGVSASIVESEIDTTGDVTVTSKATLDIDSGVGAGALAIAGSSGSNAALAGSGVSATNDIYADVDAYIDNTSGNQQVKGSSLTISATNNSSIDTDAGAAVVAAGFGQNGIAGTVGVALASNRVDTNSRAYVAGADLELGSGALDVDAVTNNTIHSLSVAVSVAVAYGNGGGLALSGAGANSINTITGDTYAYLENSNLLNAGNASIDAKNKSKISAEVQSAAGSVGGGAGGGVGVSIGASVTENIIGRSSNDRLNVSSYIKDSSINASGKLSLKATGNMTIISEGGAIGLAIAGGSKIGGAGAGSGVVATNDVYAAVNSYIDNSGNSLATIAASSIDIDAVSNSTINATLGSAALGFAGSGGASGTITIALSIADNWVDINTVAYIKGASSIDSSGAINLDATATNDVDADSHAATLGVGFGAAGAFAVSGAGAESNNTIFGVTETYIDDSNIDNATHVSLNASDTSDIKAVVSAVAASGAGGAGGGFGLAIGAALSTNTIGSSNSRQGVRTYIKNSDIDASGDVSLSAIGDMTIYSGVGAGSVAITGGAGGGASGAGAGASTQNEMYTDVVTYIDNSSASSKSIESSSLTLDADNTTDVSADTASATLAGGFGAGGGIAGTVGVALAKNIIDANTSSYIMDVSQILTGDVSVTATTDNKITATSVAASVSAAGGAGGGVALSGAGAETVNEIGGDTLAYIANSTLGKSNNKVGNVDVLADNTSKIKSTIASVAAAGAGGAAGGVGVAIGGAVAVNEIGEEGDNASVSSYVDNMEIYALGDVDVDASLDMTINAGVGVGSFAATGGAAGVAVGGAVLRVENYMHADVDSYIEDSSHISATDISVTSSSTSDIDATAAAATLTANIAPAGAAISLSATRVINEIEVSLNSDIDNSTLDASGDFTLTASSTDDVNTTGVATSVAVGIGFAGAGVFAESKVTGDISVAMVDSDITAAGDGEVKALANAKQNSEGYGIAAGFIAAGVVFADSETDVDTTLTMSATDYQGGDLAMVAQATEDNFVLAVAGSGGVAAGAGVGADTKSTSTTQVTVDDESSITLGVNSGTGVLDVKAEHLTKFDAKVTAASGGLLSGSGAEVDHEMTADVTVSLGDDSSNNNGLVISASDINVDAINRAHKNEGGKITAAAGGLVSAAGVDSRTVLDMATTLDVGDDAQLTAWGTGDDDGIALNVLNDLDITDKVILNASGALAGTGATVKITEDQLLATVRVGEDAVLTSVGELQIAARGQGTAVGNVEADSSGAISASVTKARVTIKPVNTVLIDLGAEMTAYGDVNISAGTDTDFNRDDYKVHALIDSFSDSIIPIDDAGAFATLSQTNAITVGAGAHVKSARQMNLHAERFGYADMNAQTKTVNWASALGGTANLGGEVTTSATGTVTNSGTLETGIRRNQAIEIFSLNDSGSVNQVTKTDGITFSTSISELSSELFEDLEFAEEQLAIFNDGQSSDTAIEAFYKSEIDRILGLLLEEGLLEEVEPGIYLASEVQTPIITINDIYAEAGRIDIRAGEYVDGGMVVAPGDASVSILNHTTASLVVNDITIPQQNGGVYLNGERQDAGTDYQPLISIVNDVDIELARTELADRFNDSTTILTWPSITVNGDISNRTGTLELKSLSGEGSSTLGKGDINIYADIDVENQIVATGGSTIISLPPGSTYSVDGSEYTKWNSEIGNNGLEEASSGEIDDLVNRAINVPSIYADNISITAEYININGKIQSGKESFTLNIDAALEDTIQNLRNKGVSGLIRLDAGSEDFSLFYDATNDQLVVGDMRVSGGYVELNGHVLNTNTNSEIELLGGYAEIDVINNTNLDVKILGLDASQRGKGTLIIRDKARGTTDNAYVTTYIKDENGVSVTTEYENGSSSSTVSGSDSMTYTPKQGWRYSWTMGQESFERRYETKGTSSWLGINAFAKDPDKVTFNGEPEIIDEPTLRGEGAFFEYVPADKNKDYTFEEVRSQLNQEKSLVRKWTEKTWWGKKTYYSKFVEETKVRDESTHSIRADYGVNITFTGKNAGSIDIVSNQGGDVIVQGAISNTEGTTSIRTTGNVYTQSTGSVGGKDIAITAGKIGGIAVTNIDGSIDAAANALRTNLANDGNGGITARTYGGRINIVEIDGPLVVKNITSASTFDAQRDTGGKVYLSAVGGIEAQSGTAGVVRGGTIHISSEAHVGTSSQALTIDSGESNNDSVSVLAINDIYLTELDGHFLAKEISSESGDVIITVSKGSLKDANTSAIRDERSYEELSSGLWVNLGLIEGSDSAQDKINDIIESYVTAREYEYSQYWNIRNGQFNGDYAVSDVATITAGEEAYYREVYQVQGEEVGLSDAALESFVDDAIATLNNKRNVEYHALHATYGQKTYDIDYEYQLSDEKRAELTATVHVWTEDELLNLISGSLLKPITNTQASIEEANVSAGGNVTIVTSEDIGSATGSTEIELDGDYSDDERVQLAAAERNDVYFLFAERNQNVVVDVVESNSGDALVRNTGSWVDDGFVAGMQIRIAGDSSNANDEGSFYEIASVTDSSLVLSTTDLSVEIKVTVDVAAISSSPDLTTLYNKNGDTWVSQGLAQDSFVQLGSSVYQITRIAGEVMDLEEVDPSATSSFTVLDSADYRVASVSKVVIDQREDIDVLVTGTINALASGNAYLGSEQSIAIGSVSGDNVRIKSKQSLTDGAANLASIFASDSLILEAGSGAIGSSTNRIMIDLGSDATLTARAQQSIHITEINSDLNIATIYSSGGTVDLIALNGSIIDSFNHDYENIRAVDIVLTANSGAIGGLDNLLDINLRGGVLTANALNFVGLNETEGNLNLDHVESVQDDVELVAHLAILDGVQDSVDEVADIVAASISLTSRFDTVGQIGNDVEIDTGSKTGKNLTISSANNTHIIEVQGDLYLNTVETGAAAIAFIAAPAGRILNDNRSGDNVVSGMTYLFAAQDIGTVDNALSTQVGSIQGQSTSGSTYIENTGALNVGGVVAGLANGLLAGGEVTITTRSPVDIIENITAVGDINLVSTDNSVNDDITIESGIKLETQASININSGDAVIIKAGAILDAGNAIVIQADQGKTGDSDPEGAEIKIGGVLTAATTIDITAGDGQDSLTMTGDVTAQAITLEMGEAADSVNIAANLLEGDTYVNMGEGNDAITINQLHTRDDSLVLDGQSGSDSYVINRSGNDADYIIDVKDSGQENDGADVLEINGLSTDDTFLIRANFVAAMHDDNQGGYSSAIERINYDSNINARLIINGLDGADGFFSDDTSAITTLDGGTGNDIFQIGQLFGSDRLSSLGTVAVGDEIETTETTLGYLSAGNSLPMVIYGGDGEDNITVYSNQAVTKLYGEDGDDNFVVRSFLLANESVEIELFGGEGEDSIEYSINAALKIDGGAGNDSVIVLGTEGDDAFMITEDGVFGAGLNIGYTGVEFAEVDGLEGDDTFYVLSTNADVDTTIIGGLGADVFHVASDVTQPIVSYSVEGRNSFINHSVFSEDEAYNGIFVNGIALNVASEENGAVAVDKQSLLVEEDGMTDSYELSLSIDEPTVTTVAYVTVSAARASSSDKEMSGGEAASILVSIDNVNFYESLIVTYESGTNWLDSTTIYVKAVEDTAAEGSKDYVISHSIISDNAALDQVDIANVEVQVYDNDRADILLIPQGEHRVTEGVSSTSYDVRLATQPKTGETVTVSLSELLGDDLVSQLAFSDSVLEFDSTNWDKAQSFTVSAVDDSDIENTFQATIRLSASSDLQNSDYNSVEMVEQAVTVVDNDRGAVIITQTEGSTLVSQNQSDEYSLVLSKKPTHPVMINLLNDGQTLFSSADTRFNAQENTVTFDETNWDQAITITLEVNPDYQEQQGQSVQSAPLQAHTLTGIKGQLNIEAGVPEGKSRTLTAAIILPTETDSELPVKDIEINEDQQTDVLNIFNDGSISDDTGILNGDLLTGLGMGEGIQYSDIEVVELFLGQGDDELTISDTVENTITAIHGGGGDDALTVTGSHADTALILFGDTTQNGWAYASTADEKAVNAREFSHAGNDIIDASGAGGSVVLYGSSGDDVMIGSEFGDHIAGGSGNDTINGLGGDDHIYGDAGFNVETSTRLDQTTQMLTVVNSTNVEGDNLETSDNLTVGNDVISGGFGSDIIIADKGVINQSQGVNRIFSTSLFDVVSVSNQGFIQGGADTVIGNEGDDIILGGQNSDLIYGGNGSEGGAKAALDNDTILGDMGIITLESGSISMVSSSDSGYGAKDKIYSQKGDDIVIAGAANDVIRTHKGDDLVLGDFGVIDLRDGLVVLRTEDGEQNASGNDNINTGKGYDRVLAGLGNDVVKSGSGNTHVISDNGELIYNASGKLELANSLNNSLGGNDKVTLGQGDNVVISGNGNDTVKTSDGNNHILSDNGTLTYSSDGVLIQAITTSHNEGGSDVVTTKNGDNIVIAGFGDDSVTTEQGNNIVIGDNGVVEAIDGVVRTIQSTDVNSMTAGNDTISLGEGDNHVIAGLGSDTITSQGGSTYLLADNGRFTINSDAILEEAISTELHLGGDDIVSLGLGNHLVIAGFGSDNVNTNDHTAVTTDLNAAGNDVIAGDNARFVFDDKGVIDTVTTLDSTLGGHDVITAGDGDNIILGGWGSDNISTGSGDDSILGDNGIIVFSDGERHSLTSTDLYNHTGGHDVISSGAGADQIIAGVGHDVVSNQSGETIIIGDDGIIVSDNEGRYTYARTGFSVLGGDDVITGGSDRDIIFGGFGSDTLSGMAGDDVIGGDGSQIIRKGDLFIFEAVDLFIGGNDTILGGEGYDRMQGHFGRDQLHANYREDALTGGYARFIFLEEGRGTYYEDDFEDQYGLDDDDDENLEDTYHFEDKHNFDEDDLDDGYRIAIEYDFDDEYDYDDYDEIMTVSLGQKQLDFVRAEHASLFDNYVKQVYAASSLGQIASNRAALTPTFIYEGDDDSAAFRSIIQEDDSVESNEDNESESNQSIDLNSAVENVFGWVMFKDRD